MPEEAILRGRVSIGAPPEDRLFGNAYLVTAQPDVLVDGPGWVPEHAILAGDEYITLGDWESAQLAGYVEIDPGVVAVALPRTGTRQQIAALEVWLTNAPLDSPSYDANLTAQINTYGDLSVDLALGQPSRFSFSVPFKKRDPLVPTTTTRALPAPQNSLGSPTGFRYFTLYAAYLTDNGVVRVPVMRGYATGESELAGGALRISGGDYWQVTQDRLEPGFSIPTGSGLPRGVVAKMLAENGHGWRTSLWEGTSMYRSFAVVNESVIQKVAELADADNLLLMLDGEGVLRAYPEVDTTSPVAMVLTTRDLIAADSVSVSGPGSNPPTFIEMGGTEQVLRENTGRRTVEKTAKAWAPYRVKVALAQQDSAGDINSTGASEEDEEFQLVNETTTRLTYEGDTLLVEEVEVKGWYNPETWRYTFVNDPDGLDGGGDYDAYNSQAFLYDSGAVKNDATPAYRWRRERFGLLGRQILTHTYDERGFLTKTETIKEGWLLLQQAIKDRGTRDVAFETVNHESVQILANGIAAKGQTSPQDGYRFVGNYGGFTAGGPDKTERSITRYEVTDDGYITSVIETREAWDALKGNSARYLYGDGTQRDTEEFEFIEVERTVEAYSQVGDIAFKQTTRTGLGGELLGVTLDPLDGYFPTATQRQDLEPDESLYADRPDLLAAFRAASPRETRPIRFDLVSLAYETRHPRAVLREDFALSENTADLERRAHTLLSLHTALPVSWSMPLCALLTPGQRVHLRVPEADLDHDVHIIAANHSEGGRNAPRVSRFSGRIYVA